VVAGDAKLELVGENVSISGLRNPGIFVRPD
jgi:hypothetical protein